MNTQQLFLQLGAIGAVLFVVYRLGVMLINKWAKSDEVKTTVLAEGMKSISQKLDAHATADAESHRDIVESISGFEGHIKGLLDAADRFTPVQGVPTQPPRSVGTYGPIQSTKKGQ